MITKITGKITEVGETALYLGIDAFEYEVLIPEFVRRLVQNKVGEEITLFTIEYLDGNPQQGKLVPRFVGFSSRIEREFFELFCSVDGVGVKKALRAMVRPVQEVASQIEEQDAKGLSALPGIGPAMSERIIAKLRRKVPKFALLVGSDGETVADVPRDVVSETFDVLLTLGHSESHARSLIDAALELKKKYKDVESLLQVVYQESHNG
ncbi:MAG: Holliday junction DNA helicase RuvA [Blastopirellula sp.]|nr:MAG: Holliday junction DNA helicase RuvA [Blastopirellula sp.]